MEVIFASRRKNILYLDHDFPDGRKLPKGSV